MHLRAHIREKRGREGGVRKGSTEKVMYNRLRYTDTSF